MKAEMQLEVLADGTIKITTGNMQGDQHASADAFIKLIAELAGGARETQSTKEHHHHHHTHQHDHHTH